MKKVLISILSLTLFFNVRAVADEGMWLLPLLEKFNIEKMHQLGCQLSAKEIYDLNNSSLKDAVVIFGGGCTGEMISDEGLLITNHHCGYSSIQALSSVEHDYLKNGYWAMNRNEELPVEGLSVTFIEGFTDVTKRVLKHLEGATTEQERAARTKEIFKEIIDETDANNPSYIKANVVSFYNGNIFYLITTKTFDDIRFVGAPPSSIGKFGGDTDNWMWPRHTGDFSLFRVYAGKDNNPAEYSEENIPYTPKKSLAISLKGVQENDFAMIMGFPGRTTRFMTSEEAKETQHISNRISIFVRGIRQAILMEDMSADPKIYLQYASTYSSSSNGWKKWIGMNETFDKLNVITRRAEQEKAFNEWVSKKSSRIEKYGNAIENINSYIRERAVPLSIYTYLAETLRRIEISWFSYVSSLDGVPEDIMEQCYQDYSLPTDKKVAAAMIKIVRDSVAQKYWPAAICDIDSTFGGDINAYIENLYSTSAFRSLESYNSAKSDSTLIANDPATLLYKSVNAKITEMITKINEGSDKYSNGKRAYLAGVLEMNGNKSSYPDANFTMRLTYGSVLSYSPRDAVKYNYYTTLDGVMQKEEPSNREFIVPSKLKELWSAKDYGRYAMENGQMPVGFITNNDITGGNSGSPVLNGKGELLGLAFDGNWEAMSGDVIFEPELQRCIAVDIRYVLFIIDKFGGAGYLLDEMNIVE